VVETARVFVISSRDEIVRRVFPTWNYPDIGSGLSIALSEPRFVTRVVPSCNFLSGLSSKPFFVVLFPLFALSLALLDWLVVSTAYDDLSASRRGPNSFKRRLLLGESPFELSLLQASNSFWLRAPCIDGRITS